MWKKEFDTSYVAFTSDGAQWLRDNTKIKLIGKPLKILNIDKWTYLTKALIKKQCKHECGVLRGFHFCHSSEDK